MTRGIRHNAIRTGSNACISFVVVFSSCIVFILHLPLFDFVYKDIILYLSLFIYYFLKKDQNKQKKGYFYLTGNILFSIQILINNF